MNPDRQARRIRSQLRSLRIARLGLWLIPILGWLFLPGNTRRQEALQLRLTILERP